VHVDSDSKASFDDSVIDSTHHAETRSREFAWMDVPSKPSSAAPPSPSLVLQTGAQVKLLATGFFNISGAAVDAAGQLYFVDGYWQRIYRWSPDSGEAVQVCDNPLNPVNLGFDRAGDLLVVSYAGNGTVYALRPGAPQAQLTLLKAELAQPRPGMTALMPVDIWGKRNLPTEKPWQYISPDKSVFIPAGNDFAQGQLYYGVKMADVLRAFSLAKATPGQPFYVTDEGGEKTYKEVVTNTGTIADMHLFAEEGGESVAQDEHGNVYLAAGQIKVYSPEGVAIEEIDVPERPIDLVFGGPERHSLYILTHKSLYVVATRWAGL
jgi:sugar lactone lactonase YvrE